MKYILMKHTVSYLVREAQNGNQQAADVLNWGNTMEVKEKETYLVLTEKK